MFSVVNIWTLRIFFSFCICVLRLWNCHGNGPFFTLQKDSSEHIKAFIVIKIQLFSFCLLVFISCQSVK